MEPTQFFTDAFIEEAYEKAPNEATTDAPADAPYDEHPQQAILGLDEWKVLANIFRADGSCMTLWELARANGKLHLLIYDYRTELTCAPRISLRRRPR